MLGRRLLAVPLLLIVAVVAAPAVAQAQADAAQKRGSKAPRLKVMTRNIYLGGNIFLPIGTQDQDEFEERTTELFNQVRFTNFPARARLLAREIDRSRPHLVGLQEVAMWRRSPAGVKDGMETRSTQVVYNFLLTLRRQLARQGSRYRVAVAQQETDIEAPTQSYDVRLTMRDVILVRRDRRRGSNGRRDAVNVGRLSKGNFDADISIPTPGGTFTSTRGFTVLDGNLRGRRFRFVNTHLESALPAPRDAQAQELVAPGGAARANRPTIVVGDLNSDRQGLTGSTPEAYRTLIGAGFRDTWRQANGNKPGFSCCLRNPLANDPPPFPGDHRIDHTLVRGQARGVRANIVGRDPRQRTSSGLWPSDHAGVVTVLKLGRGR